MIRQGLLRTLAILSVALLFSISGCGEQKTEAPLAKQGVIDLSGWAPGRDAPAALDGEWEFYWRRWLVPEDFQPGAKPPELSGYLNFPGSWKDYKLYGQTLPDTGWATFRLRVLPPPGNRHLGVKLLSVLGAYRLWINGKFAAAAGRTGEDAQSEISERSCDLAAFESSGEPIELVLQVSNHSFRRGGGLHFPIFMDAEEALQRNHIQVWSWSMFFVGGLLVMSVYHFFLYFLRKKDASTLYFGLYCLLISYMYSTLDSSEWLIKLFFPNIDTMITTNIGLICYTLLPSIQYRFFRALYPKEFIILIQYFCDLRSITFSIIFIFTSYYTIYQSIPILVITSFLFSTCYIIQLAICAKRGHDSAILLFFGCALLAAGGFSEMFRHLLGSVPGSILPIGFSAFILSQAFALAQRFSHAFYDVESMSRSMEAKNIALNAEMEERNRLEREVIKISEAERRRFSHDLHDGLCQLLSAIRLRCSILERSSIEDEVITRKITEISSLLEDSVSQAYDLSHGLCPVEHAGSGSGPSLKDLAWRISQASGIKIDYFEDLECARCRNEHIVQLYRIAQEAVANAVKHAKPSRVSISLKCLGDRRLSLFVRDDGIGRSAAKATEKGGRGLHIMNYRARLIGAKLELCDADSGGTLLACELSCAAKLKKE